jgi:hypothetical protein
VQQRLYGDVIEVAPRNTFHPRRAPLAHSMVDARVGAQIATIQESVIQQGQSFSMPTERATTSYSHNLTTLSPRNDLTEVCMKSIVPTARVDAVVRFSDQQTFALGDGHHPLFP